MKKIYRDRLNRLADYLQSMPSYMFNPLNSYYNHPDIPGCDAAGWAVRINKKRFGFEKEFCITDGVMNPQDGRDTLLKFKYYVPNFVALAEYFGMKYDDFYDLMCEPKTKNRDCLDFEPITKRMAVNAIRRYVNSDRVFYYRPRNKD